jgi:hypothetical protein
VPTSPQRLLEAADRMLSLPPNQTDDEWVSGQWSHDCAQLIRQALVVALDGYWRRVAPLAASCSVRAQLLLLPQFADVGTVLLANESWTGLTRAMERQNRELDPAVTELRNWHSDVSAVTIALA